MRRPREREAGGKGGPGEGVEEGRWKSGGGGEKECGE